MNSSPGAPGGLVMDVLAFCRCDKILEIITERKKGVCWVIVSEVLVCE